MQPPDAWGLIGTEKKLEHNIRKLIALQDYDFAIYQIKQKQNAIPGRLKALEHDLKQKERQLDEDLSDVDGIRRERRQLEQDIADLDSRINKSKVKLSNIKSNKEYTAALKEIEDLGREKSQREDRLLEIMETAEAVESKCKAIQDERDAFRKKYEQDQAEIEKEMEALSQEIKVRESECSGIRAEIDEAILKQYDFIKERKEGIGLSSVIKGVCQTCHLSIPPQKFNELMRGTEMMSCPHCLRIIYWGDDERYK